MTKQESERRVKRSPGVKKPQGLDRPGVRAAAAPPCSDPVLTVDGCQFSCLIHASPMPWYPEDCVRVV